MAKTYFALLCVSIIMILAGCASVTSVSDADLQMRQQAVARTDRLIVPGGQAMRIL